MKKNSDDELITFLFAALGGVVLVAILACLVQPLLALLVMFSLGAFGCSVSFGAAISYTLAGETGVTALVFLVWLIRRAWK